MRVVQTMRKLYRETCSTWLPPWSGSHGVFARWFGSEHERLGALA